MADDVSNYLVGQRGCGRETNRRFRQVETLELVVCSAVGASSMARPRMRSKTARVGGSRLAKYSSTGSICATVPKRSVATD